MTRRPVDLIRSEVGAVAATYAIALMGLIVVAGVGFDYTRMVTVDSELQNAADQAALAAATQLDRLGETSPGAGDGACARASAAAERLLRNLTMVSNDRNADGNRITVSDDGLCGAGDPDARPGEPGFKWVRFFQDTNKTIVANTDAEARFVEVWVNPREAIYALTPVMATFSGSGDLYAAALAGVGSAICRTPPVMMCNPEEPDDNTDVYREFNVEAHQGAGFRLIANDSLTPGAFGWLETGSGNGANELLAALGWDVRPGDCVAEDGVRIKEGMAASVLDGLSVRFDVPGNGLNCPTIDGTTGVCSPSVNARKDLVRQNNGGWSVHLGSSADFAAEAYRPTSSAVYPAGTGPRIMGHPRDLCHAWSNVGNCAALTGIANGRLGTGDWDIQAYWRANYDAPYAGQVDASDYGPQRKGYPSRYQVYRWEADKIVDRSLPGIIKSAGGGESAYAQPQEGKMMATANFPYGLIPGSEMDRRRISVATLNCNALKAKAPGGSLNGKDLEVATWLDVFLVEPSIARQKCKPGGGKPTPGVECNDIYTEKHDVYVELIEKTDLGGDNGASAQTIRRDIPYLIQ